jgi:hypothetical protein
MKVQSSGFQFLVLVSGFGFWFRFLEQIHRMPTAENPEPETRNEKPETSNYSQ